MKNKLFSGKLYLEGLRRVRTLGLIYVISMMVVSIIPQLINNLTETAYNSYGALTHYGFTLDEDDAMVLIVSFIIAVPVLTLVQFAFLNKRSSSDFFHSIPESRTSLFFSFSLATYTWAAAGIILPWASRLLLHIIVPKNDVDPCYFMMLPIFLIVCLLVEGGILIAMSQTGTLLTNIVVSGIVLFAPRLIMFALIAVIDDITPVLVNSYEELPVLDYHYNLLFSFFDWEWEKIGISIIYSSILAIVYFAIALLLFKKRKSETAEQSAQNDFVQCAVRTIIAFCFCLPAIVSLIEDTDFELVIIFYALALIAYFAYEAITKRSFRSFGKAAWQIVFLIALNVVMFILPNAVMRSVAKSTPRAQSVQSVSVNTSYSSIEEYYAKDVSCTNTSVINILTTEAENNAKEMAAGKDISGSKWIKVKFNLKDGSTVERRVKVASSENTTIGNVIKTDEAYIDATLKKPEFEELQTVWFTSGGYSNVEDVKNIYNAFLEDYNAMSRNEKIKYLDSVNKENESLCNLVVELNNKVSSSYPIDMEHTPKAARLIVKCTNLYGNYEMNELLDANITWFYLGFNESTTYNQLPTMLTGNEEDAKLLEEIRTALRKELENPGNADDYAGVMITYGNGDMYVMYDGNVVWNDDSSETTRGTEASVYVFLPVSEGNWLEMVKAKAHSVMYGDIIPTTVG